MDRRAVASASAALALIAALACECGAAPARPAEAESRGVYLRAGTPEARLSVAPFVTHEFPDGILRARMPAGTLAALAASPGLVVLGSEAVYRLAPIEWDAFDEAEPVRAADSARTCFVPRFTSPVGWGIRAMYESPGLTRSSGGAGVKVGVLDGGVWPHPDLARRIAQCSDFTGDGELELCDERTLHGTAVASVIAADGGADGLGMWGMAPEASIYSYRVCETNDGCYGAYVAAAIYAAIEDGVNIINLSIAGPGHDEVVEAAIEAAVARNILVIAAAGNSPPYSYLGYPAVYPTVVSVGAIREDLSAWPYSAPGRNNTDNVREPHEIEVAAPGSGVLGALKGLCYVLGHGTSLAAPHVAGLAAKLWSGDARALRTRLQASAQAHDLHVAGNDSLTGLGLPTIVPVHSITSSAGPGGTVSPAGTQGVLTGQTRVVTIAPESPCHVIQDVVVDGESRGAVPSFTFADVSADHTIHATFATLGPFTITASAGPGGTISPSGDTSTPCGAQRRFTITPSSTCQPILDVRVDGVSRGRLPSYTFTAVMSDHTIEAAFVPALGLEATHTAASWTGVNDGTIDLTVAGGVPPYTYAWSNGARSEDVANLASGRYTVRVTDAVRCTNTLAVTIANAGTTELVLGPPAPNPCRGAMRFRYGVPLRAEIRISVVDLRGREVAVLADRAHPAGWYWADWNGEMDRGRGTAPAGVYFVRLQAEGHHLVQRFGLIR